jgi:transcriptional regulator with XRE-family HTH domain
MNKPDIRQIVGRNLAAARERAGLTQAELAKRSGVSQSHISEVERAITAISADLINDITWALRMQPWELLADSEVAKQAALATMLWGTTKGTNERVEQFFPPAPKTEAAPPKAKKRGRRRKDQGSAPDENKPNL